MTTPRYPSSGCVAGSQVRGDALPVVDSPDNAWIVNFNNGNSNWNNRNNNGFVRAVRPGECQGADADVSLHDLYRAFTEARRGKKPSRNQLDFESRWLDRLLDLQAELNSGTWQPRPSTCFIARSPKAREIHAPDFADRVVHHWLVPQLEALWEPTFIHDCYSNRKGKGTHAAVDRLQAFVRQVHSGQGSGWYLQLDIKNFFNSIPRLTLWQILKRQLERRGVSHQVQRITHALLRHSPGRHGVVYRCRPSERALVPMHKRLENAPVGRGLPIGNLSSQFLANAFLNELDQFIKHQLKAERYLRYVDDFVLVHQSREQLQAWHVAIERFLADRLQLDLKDDVRLKPLSTGVDFLGYVIYPTHRIVRRRVVHHVRQKLRGWSARHFSGENIRATPAEIRRIESVHSSYIGHLSHARTWRLQQRLLTEFPWLRAIRRRFDHRLEGRRIEIQIYRGAT